MGNGNFLFFRATKRNIFPFVRLKKFFIIFVNKINFFSFKYIYPIYFTRSFSMNKKNNKKNDGKRRYRDRNKGATYYITCNINRFKTELTEIEIKEMLLWVLSQAKLKFKFEMKDFVILNDHCHFIIRPDENEDEYYLSKIMKWILSVFAKRYNKYTGQSGKVWYDRFMSEIIEVGRKIFWASCVKFRFIFSFTVEQV